MLIVGNYQLTYQKNHYICTAKIAIMIEVKNLYKSFGEQTVLNGINCIFEPGVNNLIIGQSGSGKTVLLKCLIGLHKPEQGEIRN